MELTVSEDWSPLSSGWEPWQQAGRRSTQQCLSTSLLGHTHREMQESGVLWNLQWGHTSQYFLSNPINWEHVSLGGHSLLNHHIAFPLLCTNWQPSVSSASMGWLFYISPLSSELFHLNIMLPRFIHFVTSDKMSLFSMAEDYSAICGWHILLLHSPTVCKRWFHLLPVVSSA